MAMYFQIASDLHLEFKGAKAKMREITPHAPVLALLGLIGFLLNKTYHCHSQEILVLLITTLTLNFCVKCLRSSRTCCCYVETMNFITENTSTQLPSFGDLSVNLRTFISCTTTSGKTKNSTQTFDLLEAQCGHIMKTTWSPELLSSVISGVVSIFYPMFPSKGFRRRGSFKRELSRSITSFLRFGQRNCHSGKRNCSRRH